MKNTHAFTLVELSIVLVMLGVLTGGVVAGQSLIRSAELRGLTSQISEYKMALITFDSKYSAIPGDMANATRYWGARDGGDGLGTDCTDNESVDELTCNGSGNGNIEFNYETPRFWQHLSNAGMIEGHYTGIGYKNTTLHEGIVIGTNYPETPINGVTFQVRGSRTWAVGNPAHFSDEFPIHFYLGTIACHINPHCAFLTGEEAWSVDTKIDDSKPASGEIRTYKGGATPGWASTSKDCATTDDPATAEYNVAASGEGCALVFLFDYF